MGVTKIEWTATVLPDGRILPGYTFNAWRGCTQISPGCVNCYAKRMAARNPKILGKWGMDGTRVIASEAYWQLPLKWNRQAKAAGERRRVFCGSMMDVFEERPELVAPRERLCGLMHNTPSLDWLLLTKRPENVALLVGWGKAWGPWPKNVWLGYSASTQADLDGGLPHLMACPAAVRFLSLEPLIEPLDLSRYMGQQVTEAERSDGGLHRTSESQIAPSRQSHRPISLVIVGGESGPKARPCNLAWIRSIVKQCRAAGLPAFVKQLGANPIIDGTLDSERLSLEGHLRVSPDLNVGGFRVCFHHRKGGDPSEWPADLRVRAWPGA